jgi:predicted PurR-regulated permease PerM
VLLVYTLATLTDILVPLAFAGFIAVLLNPVANRLQRYKLSRGLSIAITMLAALMVVAAVFYFLSSQIVQFGDSLPALKQKFGEISHDLKLWIQDAIGTPVAKQDQMIKEALDNGQGMVAYRYPWYYIFVACIYLLFTAVQTAYPEFSIRGFCRREFS